MSNAQAPQFVDPSHLPTIIDVLETERDALRARLALLEPVFAAAREWHPQGCHCKNAHCENRECKLWKAVDVALAAEVSLEGQR